jgi:hypothetical protein
LVEFESPSLTPSSRTCVRRACQYAIRYLRALQRPVPSRWGLARVPASSDSTVLATGASAAAWSMQGVCFPHQRCGDSEVSVGAMSVRACLRPRPSQIGPRRWCRPTLKVAATPCRRADHEITSILGQPQSQLLCQICVFVNPKHGRLKLCLRICKLFLGFEKLSQHHHQVVRVGHFVGLSEIGGTRCRDCTGLDSIIRYRFD